MAFNSFHDFIADWRVRRLRDLEAPDFESRVQALANEIGHLARERGYRRDLNSACEPYRSMVDYVRGLRDIERHRSRPS